MKQAFVGAAAAVGLVAACIQPIGSTGFERASSVGGGTEPLTSRSSSHVHLMPLKHKKTTDAITTAAAGAHLVYNGGPLLGSVKVAAVFWGPNVVVASQIGSFFSDITASPYIDWLSEYDVNGKSIARGSYIGGFTDPSPPGSSSIQDSDIQSEVDRLISAGTVPPNDPNTLYMVYFPPGVSISMGGGDQSCVTFCAYHGSYTRTDGSLVFYGVMPDLGGACASGCGDTGSQLSDTTEVSSHEFAESITDPDVGNGDLSWYDQVNGEIGDICVGEEGTVDGFAVQLLWSNKNNACIATDPSVPPQGDAGPPSNDAGAPDSSVPPSDDAGAPPGQDASPPPPPPPGNGCSSEQEPNDTSGDADPLPANGCLSGSLDPSGDIDWSTFTFNGAGIAYDITLQATDDAELALYKLVGGVWYTVANTSPTEIAHTSNGPGLYALVVFSQSGAVQDYTLALATQ